LRDLILNGIRGWKDLAENAMKTNAHPERYASMRTVGNQPRWKEGGQNEKKRLNPRAKADGRKTYSHGGELP